ncbi:hypothetical protein AVEN_261304-1 [Araneus ventricosus]|uniref:Uncharacterized protein n=1 Tax=Araneus ventricosus TaxID=182803 RepID=A0A4Y2SLK9_ARAVE|nr:hypothetical protein AVEN_261304-1 [Araneus ventricosus]
MLQLIGKLSFPVSSSTLFHPHGSTPYGIRSLTAEEGEFLLRCISIHWGWGEPTSMCMRSGPTYLTPAGVDFNNGGKIHPRERFIPASGEVGVWTCPFCN